AIDMQLQRRVALKVLKPQWSLNAAYINAYQREADLIARLSHPHIVAYYSMGQTADKSFYIAMEYLDRGTLSEELERTNKFSIEEAIRYIEQIAGALGYAHRNNILHLDVKPQNILLRTVPRRPLEAVLVDFGIARAARAYEDDLDTVEPSTLLGIGTGPYLSPEQVQDGVLDQRTDIYSLAVTTYEIMTGELPYKAGNLVALVNQIVTTEPPTPSSFGVPDAVSQVILKGMQKSPVYRYETANEFAAALRAAFDRGIAPEPIPDQQTTTQPSPPTERWDRIDTSATETIITIVDERRLSETPANLNELTEQLMQVFSLLELKGMSFDFNIDRNVINTNNAAEFVTQLLTHVNRQNRLDEFLSLCEQMKPDINWQQFKS
ncbi:MAG: serine/threonine protein kinase, partial [Anaerolineales bacterium]|nr:serine/threonine protein kinase [Anaerolineales bacterium]